MPEHNTYIEVFGGACVHPDTCIDIDNGFLKLASDIKVGDLVLTHKGNYKEVKKVFIRNYDGDVYVISGLYTSGKLVVTPEHPVLVMKRKLSCDVLNFVEARNIEKGDYLVYPNHKEIDVQTMHREVCSQYVYTPLHSIEKVKYTGEVYNFEVADDNSYVANGFSVHNCWVFFRKKPSKIEIVNDVNSELINFYRVIQRQCNEFKKREKYEMYSSDLYYEYLQDFYSGKHKTLDNNERAFRFFCLIKEAFGSKFGGGFGFGSVRNNAIAFFNEFKIIDDVSKRLKNVVIDNRDFEEVIKSYDNDKVLFYTDPPYMKSDNADYYFKSSDSSFTIHDHQRLFLALKNIKGKCILTIDSTEWVKERYTEENGFYSIENEVFYCSADKNNRRHEVELIILNYDPKSVKKHVDVNQSKLEF